jgi:hypothetical protein
MPKETVQYPKTDVPSSTEVTVHWSKENMGGYVQLGVTRHVFKPLDPEAKCSPIHADHSSCDECAQAVEYRDKLREEQKELGLMPMMRADFTDAPPVSELDDPATVFTEVLDRGQINNMIRTLRRARDQAYGPDA